MHTPGPWHVEDSFVLSSQRECVAQVGGPINRTPTSDANARLIAAAPELLAALSDLVAICDGRLPEKRLPIEAARAAKAKATGGQSPC